MAVQYITYLSYDIQKQTNTSLKTLFLNIVSTQK